MAGRAHAAGYRSASTLFGTERPDVRLAAIADTNGAVADDTATRYGYERAEYDWRAIAQAPDIDAVSVVVANHRRSDRVTAVGYTYRRSPAAEQIRRELASGKLGDLVHFNGHYWCDYA